MPEGKIQAEKLYKKLGLNLILKPTSEIKTKYWDCNKKYPTSIDGFIEMFFKKKKPKNLEGIWIQYFKDQHITFGLVEKGGVYHGYIIDNQLKMIQTTGSFFKDIFSAAIRLVELLSKSALKFRKNIDNIMCLIFTILPNLSPMKNLMAHPYNHNQIDYILMDLVLFENHYKFQLTDHNRRTI